MALDTNIPLSNLLRPHVQSPAESFGFEQQVIQARQEQQQRQQKMQQDQQMKQIFSNPKYQDAETGGLNMDGIIAGGRVLGPDWSGKAAHQLSQTYSSLSESKKRMQDIKMNVYKASQAWGANLYKEALADLTAQGKATGVPPQVAFTKVRADMERKIDEFWDSGEAAKIGLDENHRTSLKKNLPNDYQHLETAAKSLGDLGKVFEAITSGQPVTEAPAGHTVNALPEGKVETTLLSDVGKLSQDRDQAIPIVKDMTQKVAAANAAQDDVPTSTVALRDVAKPAEAPKAKTPTQKRDEAQKLRNEADAQFTLGNLNNAKTKREQAQILVAEADKLVREAHRDDEEARKNDAEKRREQQRKDKNTFLADTPKPLTEEQTKLNGNKFLETLPAGERNLVKAIADGEIDPSVVSKRNNQQERIMERVKQYDPSYNQQTYKVASATRAAFAKGVESRAIKSFNVGLEHLDTLQEVSEALSNNDLKKLNQLKTFFKDQFGEEEPSNFNFVKQAVAAEIVKAIVGGTSALADREEMARNAMASASPKQLAGVILQAKKLFGGQLHGLEQQYKAGTGGANDFRQRYLTPSGKRAAEFADEDVKKHEARSVNIPKGMKSVDDGIPKTVIPQGVGTQPPKTLKWNDLK